MRPVIKGIQKSINMLYIPPYCNTKLERFDCEISLYTDHVELPMSIGKPRRNPNCIDSYFPNPSNTPVIVVIPDLEVPGIKAKH